MSDVSPKVDMQRVFRALEGARKEIELLKLGRGEPIAAIGMGCRFPGARDTAELWHLIERGGDAVSDAPVSRWRPEGLLDPEAGPGKIYVNKGGFLDDVELFDEAFFAISPREAQKMDPQQRLLLETAWHALEDANVTVDRSRPTPTGVFVGISNSEYPSVAGPGLHGLDGPEGFEALDSFSITGSSLNAAAGRIAYVFGLNGPALAVDTACSSSLVALHLACRSLADGECEQALAAGVNLILSPRGTVALCQSRVLSPTGRCRPFDADANGMVRAEGCGVLVLKTLRRAQRDGDRILGVIRASGVNQDGPSSGLTVPNEAAQADLMERVLARAGLKADDIDLIEGHGTGTSLGDPIELNALHQVYGKAREAGRPLYVGSIKTNIGHSESASGMAGVIKALLSIRHRTIARHPHFDRPNPHFDWAGSPLTVPTKNLAWDCAGRTRRAAVSSFGFSGTNAHVILEEGPSDPRAASPATDAATDVEPGLLPVTARTAGELETLAASYATLLADPARDFGSVCRSAQGGRRAFAHRLVVMSDDAPDARGLLLGRARAASAPTGFPQAEIFRGEAGIASVAFVFSGQGSQCHGMGAALWRHNPIFQLAFSAAAALIDPELGQPLEEVLWRGDKQGINRTLFAQPGLFAIEYALGRLLLELGFEPQVVAGHSVGEIAAACLAGVFSLEDACRLICARARLMDALPLVGGMVAVKGDAAAVKGILRGFPELDLAAENSPHQYVVSGERRYLPEVVRYGEERGLRVVPLAVSHAFHSRLMAPMLDDFRRAVETITFRRPRLPFLSSVTGSLADDQIANAGYWVDQISRTVRFASVAAQLVAMEISCTIEVGPGSVLTGLVQQALPGICGDGVRPVAEAPLRDATNEWRSLLGFVSRTFVAGAPVKWEALHRARGKHADLPLYPFTRRRFWPTPAVADRLPADSGLLYVVDHVPVAARDARQGEVHGGQGDGRWLQIDGADALSADGMRALLTADTRGVVFVLSHDASEGMEPGGAADLDRYRGPFDTLVSVVRAMGDATGPRRQLVLLTRQAIAIDGEDNGPGLFQSPLLGIGNAIRAEMPELGCVNVDTDDPSGTVARLDGFLADTRERVYVVRGDRLLVPRLLPHTVAKAVAPPIDPDAAFLVTGGLGGVGRLLLRWLVGKGAKHLWTIDRSGSASPERKLVVDELLAAGVDLRVECGDIGDARRVDALFGAIATAGRPLKGVFHLAGVTGDGLLANQDSARLGVVIGPKIGGTWNLHRATVGLDLDHFVLFSSMAASFSAPGQGCYAFASAFLDGMADYRASRGLPVLTLDFGPWSAGGMAASEAGRARRREWGILPMESTQALRALEEALASGRSRVVVANIARDRLAQTEEARSNGFFTFMGAVGESVKATPAAPSRPSLRGAIDQALPLPRRRLLADLVIEKVVKVLRMPDSETIKESTSFHELGFDSLVALELRNEIARALEIELPSTVVYDHPSIKTMVDLLDRRFAAKNMVAIEGAGAMATPTRDAAVADTGAEAVAIVGLACRFPGGADSPGALWELLVNDREGVGPLGNRRWDGDHYYDPDPDAPGKMYSDRGGVLDDIDAFDNELFGISPREASYMDPQQRILLQTAWEAIENAGYAPEILAGARGGVFVGAAPNEYGNAFFEEEHARLNHHMLVGNALSVIAGRLSYQLDWRGPSLVVDTACSSSLVAVHMGAVSLLRGECEVAIAGGVNLTLLPTTNVMLSKAKMLARDGRCKTFDARADGYVRSEGCGVIVMKRLADARRDRDRIIAVIKGSASNQDGRSQGLTAPNVNAQIDVMRSALRAAGLEPEDVSYVEAHGTGTQLGDPIEVRGIDEVYGRPRTTADPLYVGSVKTNLGHTEAAAGVAGLIKTVLALAHGRIPGNVHLETLNPHFGLAVDQDRNHLRFPTAAIEWPAANGPRRAAVSSFGFSGTNAHVILEEGPPALEGAETDRGAQIVAISAQTADGLRELAAKYGDALARTCAPIGDIAFTANCGRNHFRHRAAILAASRDELRESLRRIAEGDTVAPRLLSGVGPFERGRRTLVVGALAGDLGWVWPSARACPALALALAGVEDEFARAAEVPLRAAAEGDPRTPLAAAARLALGVALARFWISVGPQPDVLRAESDLAAACVGGVLDLGEAVKLRLGSSLLERLELRPAVREIAWLVQPGAGAIDREAWRDRLAGLTGAAAPSAPERQAGGDSAWHVDPGRGHSDANGTARRDPLLWSVMELYATGADLRWDCLYDKATAVKVPLPTYPFQKRRFWAGRQITTELALEMEGSHDIQQILSEL